LLPRGSHALRTAQDVEQSGASIASRRPANERGLESNPPLLARIEQLAVELDQLHGWENERQLGTPASPAQMALIQQTAGFELPPDYRAFLELHNGWQGFSGENALLSAEQMMSGPMRSSIAETKDIQRETDDSAINGFVINASISGSDIAYIDPSTRKPDGIADVVRWDPRMREYKRFPSFTAYLAGQVDLLERLIAKERAKLR
jgi:hypothetical protein